MRNVLAKFQRLQQAERFWLAASILGIIAIGAVVAVIGPTIIMAPWDVFILLDGGWRIFNGQIPNTNFHNPIGPLVYWLIALGMHITGPSLYAYVFGNLTALAALGPFAAFVFFRKLSGPLAFFMTLFFAFLITATHPLGYDASTTTYAMIYNRYGWALISVLFIQVLFPIEDRSAMPAHLMLFQRVSCLDLFFSAR